MRTCPELRFDVKGNRHLDTPHKYYAGDCGLRNAAMGFRQNERPHLMENAVYNELIGRGYAVDVGVVDHKTTTETGKQEVRHTFIGIMPFLLNSRALDSL